MKKILLLMACAINLATVMQAENEPVYQWGKLTDGAGSDNPSEIKVNRDGDYFIFSTFASNGTESLTTSFGDVTVTGAPNSATSGNYNFVLYKTDAQGNVEWHVNSNMGDVTANSSSVEPTSDGGALLAMKIRHTNRNEHQNDIILSIVSNDESVQSIEKTYEGSWSYEGALVKIDANGIVEWTKLIEEDHTQQEDQKYVPTDGLDFYDITTDVDGNYYIAGRFRCPVTIDEQVLTPRNIEGWTGDSQTQNGDMFVWKMDKDGKLVWNLTTTGDAITYESVKRITYSEGALYMVGMIKGDETKSVKLGEISLTPNAFINTFTAKITTEKRVEWAKIYPSTAFTDGKSNNQVEALCVRKGIMLIGGALKGGISADDLTVESETASLQGYVLKCDTKDGKLLAVNSQKGTGISKITEAFITDNQLLVYGYLMSQSLYIDSYDMDLNNVVKNNIITGGGAATSWGAALYNNTTFCYARGRGTFALSGTDDTFATQEWGGLVAAYNLPINNSYTVTYLSDDEFYKNETYNFNETITAAEAPEKEGFELTEWEGLPKTTPGVDIVVKAIWQERPNSINDKTAEDNIKVYASAGQIIIKTQEVCRINIFSVNGQLLKTIDINGTENINMPQGIYLVNGKKVIVY